MLTPAQLQDLAEGLEEIYAHITDDLLINIGKHIRDVNWTHTADYEIRKLSELGQLTQENAAIINRWIKQIPKVTRDTMEETRRIALEKLEKQMEAAAKAGHLTPPAADSTGKILTDYANQAIDRFNLVNTTMLDSSIDIYTQAIRETSQTIFEMIERQEKLQASTEAVQGILNDAAGKVALGTETRREAVKEAIRQVLQHVSDEGLCGFVDRAGRQWTPEAYVNMCVRTTVHNVAIESTKARMQDWNTSVFQVSSHAGARPGCYPYQGKFYSWDNSSGEIPLGNGQMVTYEPINATSYGEPAGLFGINCGHYPIPVVPGVSIPHGADNIQPPEENNKAYEESQQQRALEREIREAKRVLEMAGDLATPEMKQRVRNLQADMRKFINETGRTRRYDRESNVENANASRGQIEEKERLRSINSNIVQENLLDAPDFLRRFNGIAQNQDADEKIYKGVVEMLKHRSGSNKEDLFLFDAETGEVIHRLTTSQSLNSVTYDAETLMAIERAHTAGQKIIAVHNHPGGLPPSLDDGTSILEHGYYSGIAVGHNLEVWTYGGTAGIIDPEDSKAIHDEFNEKHQLLFSVDFEENLWYDMLNEYGMEVQRK